MKRHSSTALRSFFWAAAFAFLGWYAITSQKEVSMRQLDACQQLVLKDRALMWDAYYRYASGCDAEPTEAEPSPLDDTDLGDPQPIPEQQERVPTVSGPVAVR